MLDKKGARISEVIRELEALMEKYGDLPVVVDHSDCRPKVEELYIYHCAKGALGEDGKSKVDCITVC